jgi:peptidoglycan/LPS O-acetylase OafA/YrhL
MNINKVHLPFLDGIRGIAILVVFLFHSLAASFGFGKLPWNGLFPDFDTTRSFLVLYPFTYGSAGVAMFFVVSGFCIHLSHQRSKDKGWLLFANRRLFRIYPPYLLAIALFFFISPWGSLDINSFPRLIQFFSHVFSIQNFSEKTLFGINPSFWSIAVEVQLYAIYPLLLLFTKRLGWKSALLIVGTIEVSIRTLAMVYGFWAENPLPLFVTLSPFGFWLSWSIGAYLCECFLAGRSSRLFAFRFDVICLIAFALPLFRPTAGFKFLAFSFLTATAIERLMTEKWKLPTSRLATIAWNHLSLLGTVSYSFYLLHQPIINLTGELFEKTFPDSIIHPLVKYLTCIAWYFIILFISYFFYRIVEQPSVHLGKIVWRKIEKPKRSAQEGAEPIASEL